jgi:alpha-tubulin suppressor-like RCC1 family protein
MKTCTFSGKMWLVLGMSMVLGLGLPDHSPAAGSGEGASQLTTPMLHVPLSDVQTAVSGGGFACALTNGGAVHCWGANFNGQLGDGTNTDRSLPVPVVGLDSGVTAIAAGDEHACAVTSTGAVKCWGWNITGQLGDGTTNNSAIPVTVAGLTGVAKAVTAGEWHTCALKTDGSIQCWGDNRWGQLGGGPNVLVSGPASSIESGSLHVCAVLVGGEVQCWGSNEYGQLGDGTTTNRPIPVTVAGLPGGAAGLSAGYDHSCAVLTSGFLRCWGRNTTGQLGDGTTTDRHNPVEVSNLTAVFSVSGGIGHSCALLQGGGLQCWGENYSGELGNGTTNSSLVPVAVTGLDQGMKAVSAGGAYTLALAVDGTVKAWGSNTYGQLGNGAPLWSNLPLDVAGLPLDKKIVATGYDYTCALLYQGGVRCWGDNRVGQLGDGTAWGSILPVPVLGLGSSVTGISAGGFHHKCAVIAEGGVQCWGSNPYGQLGDGTTNFTLQPVNVQGLNSLVVAVATGRMHTCALDSTGEVFCWGGNGYGQLGNGTFFNSTVPVKVDGLSAPAAAITAGDFHTCARLATGVVQCWGENLFGELGNGDNTDSAVPVLVKRLQVISLDAGGDHTCAVTSAGAVKCWGRNIDGELGNGTFGNDFNSNIPVDVVGLSSGFQTVISGDYHTCATSKFSGALKCWGKNTYGQLGDGTNIQRNTPIDVSGMAAGVTSLDLGFGHTCAVLSTKRLKCWGWNGNGLNGLLGLGSPDLFKVLAPINVLATVDPQLTWNYPNGKPGSFFTLTGQHFPPNSFATVKVNGAVLTANLAINPTGGFILFFDTAGADPGFYQVEVMVDPIPLPDSNVPKSPTPSGLKFENTTARGSFLKSQFVATSSFILDPSAPLNSQEGGGQVLAVPVGIGGFKVYLPLLLK